MKIRINVFPGSPVGFVGHNPDLGWSNNVNKPNLYSESEIKNYVLNSDIFLNNLIAWSTKQSEDSETILNISNEIEKFETTIYETNLTKIIQ